MSIVSKINRDGVDVVIESLQQKFYSQLIGFWETSATYQMYPRANKNYKSNNIIPEISLDQKDYSEVLTSDKFSVTSFFLNNDSRIFQDEFKRIKQSISIIFQADLVALYDEAERMDEVFNIDVLRVLRKENFYIFGDIEIVEGVDNVYSDLGLTGALKDNINLTDISQFHVVKFTFDVIYKPNCNVTLTSVCAGVSISVDGVFSEVKPSGSSYNCVTGGGGSTPVDVTVNGELVYNQVTTDQALLVRNSLNEQKGSLVSGNWLLGDQTIEIYEIQDGVEVLIDTDVVAAMTDFEITINN